MINNEKVCGFAIAVGFVCLFSFLIYFFYGVWLNEQCSSHIEDKKTHLTQVMLKLFKSFHLWISPTHHHNLKTGNRVHLATVTSYKNNQKMAVTCLVATSVGSWASWHHRLFHRTWSTQSRISMLSSQNYDYSAKPINLLGLLLIGYKWIHVKCCICI